MVAYLFCKQFNPKSAGLLSVFLYYFTFAVLFFVWMGVAVVPRPMFGLWGRLVFWFGLFFEFC